MSHQPYLMHRHKRLHTMKVYDFVAYNKIKLNKMREKLITDITELASDFWTMNLHNGTFESHLRTFIINYDKAMNYTHCCESDSEPLVCNSCGCPNPKKTYDGYWCKMCHNEM